MLSEQAILHTGDVPMPTIVFDTHSYVKKLKAAGMPEAQAEVQAETIATLVDENLVTRQHFDTRIRELEARIEARIKELKVRIKELELTFQRQMAEIKAELIKWVLGISAAQAALIVTLLKAIK
jgi:capsule polysaccharide export protein KpsE/RkpR